MQPSNWIPTQAGQFRADEWGDIIYMISPTEFKVVVGLVDGKVWECGPDGWGIWAYTHILDEEEKSRLL